jgi:hypothetical protein
LAVDFTDAAAAFAERSQYAAQDYKKQPERLIAFGGV